MPGKRSFIDSRPKLFIALKQIDMDTFYRHVFIIAERRYPVTLYEQLVIELTNRSFSLHAAYRSGSTPYELSDREPEPYDQQIEDFARMIEEADCVLVGGASGLSAAGGGDFYYEDNATYRRHFGKFAERYGFKGAFEGSFYRWPTAEARWGYLATFLDTTLNAPLRKPYRNLDAILAEKDFFVLTTNQDTQFVKLYPWEKVAEIQGDHRFFQCSHCCPDEVWSAVEPVPHMVEAMVWRFRQSSCRAARTAGQRRSPGFAATATSCRANSTRSSTARCPTGSTRTHGRGSSSSSWVWAA